MKQMNKLIALSLALIAALSIILTACSKPTDAGPLDAEIAAPEASAVETAKTVPQTLAGSEILEVKSTVIEDDFEYPLENRTENQILPDFGKVQNGLDMCVVYAFTDLDDVLRQYLKPDGAIVTGRKISCVSYSKFEKTEYYYEFSEVVKGDIIRYYTITRFLVESVAEGQGIKAGDIITVIEDYSFLDDGTAYQMMPLYAPPVYDDEKYLLIVSPDTREYTNVKDAWDIRIAVRIDEFSRNYEQYSIEETLQFEQKRGYFYRFDIAKEMIERFVDGK